MYFLNQPITYVGYDLLFPGGDAVTLVDALSVHSRLLESKSTSDAYEKSLKFSENVDIYIAMTNSVC